jgi:hypothetical protein
MMWGENARYLRDSATHWEGDAMAKRAFDPDDPEFEIKNQHARIVVFSTVCILVSLGVIGICVPLLLAKF